MPKGSKPFSISPTPSALHLTPALLTAIHKAKYVIDERQGLTAILGDVGHGKSSLLRFLASDYMDREDCRMAYISQPSFRSDFAFVKAVASEFDLSPKRSMYDQLREFQRFLVEQFQADRNVILFVDEAQRLDDHMLEQVRGFLNFETDEDKLIQIVLAAQLELGERLKKKTHKAVRSRVLAPSVLPHLSADEIAEMLEHRCKLAGIAVPFSPPVYEQMFKLTGGVPREVLKLAGMAYDFMKMSEEREITPALIDGLAEEFRLAGDGDPEPVEAT